MSAQASMALWAFRAAADRPPTFSGASGAGKTIAGRTPGSGSRRWIMQRIKKLVLMLAPVAVFAAAFAGYNHG
jgi:hypothetical protein